MADRIKLEQPGSSNQVAQSINVVVVVVLMTIGDGALHTLLVRTDEQHWALPRVMPASDEPLRSAAERVIREHGDFKVDYLEQLYTFGNRVEPGFPRAIEITYYGLVPSELHKSPPQGSNHPSGWFARDAATGINTTEAKIIELTHNRLRGKLKYTAVGFELLPEKFSMAELQRIYEIISGKNLDKRNFRKKMIFELGIVEATGEKRSSQHGRGRPSELFRFRPEVFDQLESKGDIFAF